MNYSIKDLNSITLIGISTRARKSKIAKASIEFWTEVAANGALNKIHEVKSLDGVFEGRVVGYLQESVDDEVVYSIGIEYKSDASNYPLDAITIPKNRWICFKFVGPVVEALANAKRQIVEEFLPKLNMAIDFSCCIEVYSNNDRRSKYYPFEIWYPLDD